MGDAPWGERAGGTEHQLTRRTVWGVKAAEARAEWGKKHLWKVCAFFGVLLMAFVGGALATDRPSAVGMPFAVGLGYLIAAAFLFRKR